jgi:hypothetical protein
MHMSHITSDRGDDLDGITRMAECERESAIRLYAYYLAEHRGFAAGHEIEDWLTAERELQAIEAARAKTWNRQPYLFKTAFDTGTNLTVVAE